MAWTNEGEKAAKRGSDEGAWTTRLAPAPQPARLACVDTACVLDTNGGRRSVKKDVAVEVHHQSRTLHAIVEPPR